MSPLLMKRGLHGFADVRRAADHADTRGFHGRHFFFRGSLSAGDDRAGVAHSSARRRRLAADKSNDGLLHIGLDIGRSFLFRNAANFPNHDNAMSVGVFVEQTDRIDEVSPDYWIAADA